MIASLWSSNSISACRENQQRTSMFQPQCAQMCIYEVFLLKLISPDRTSVEFVHVNHCCDLPRGLHRSLHKFILDRRSCLSSETVNICWIGSRIFPCTGYTVLGVGMRCRKAAWTPPLPSLYHPNDCHVLNAHVKNTLYSIGVWLILMVYKCWDVIAQSVWL